MNDIDTLPQGEIDPYVTLEISEQASAAEVKTAYRKLALRHHPGKNIQSGTHLRMIATDLIRL